MTSIKNKTLQIVRTPMFKMRVVKDKTKYDRESSLIVIDDYDVVHPSHTYTSSFDFGDTSE